MSKPDIIRISVLRVKGYKSFGPNEITIHLQDKLAAFIVLNSAGKTIALKTLKKLFGSSIAEREIYRHDFHIGKDENPDDITDRELSIEARIGFSEEEQEAVPHFFSDMVVDDEDTDGILCCLASVNNKVFTVFCIYFILLPVVCAFQKI